MNKIKVEISPTADGEIREVADFFKLAELAGWSDDPGTGVAVLLLDERGAPGYEVLNPLPFAPPIGFEPTPPIEQLIADRVRAELARLRDEEEIDDILDAEDFDVDDDLPPLETIYEVIAMKEEAPGMQLKEPSAEERAKADVEYEELKEQQRLLRKRHREAQLKRQDNDEIGRDPPQDPEA